MIAGFSGIDNAYTQYFYLLLYVTGGTGTHTVDFITYRVRAGSLFLLAPGHMHSWSLSADCQGYLLFFEADFYQQHYPSTCLQEHPFFKPLHSPIVELPTGGTITVLLEHVLQEAENYFVTRLEMLRLLPLCTTEKGRPLRPRRTRRYHG